MEEQWKDIKGYEGLYQVSNLGRVKSLERYIQTKRGQRLQKERVMSNLHNENNLVIRLRYFESEKNFTIHRLVAKHFIKDFTSESVVGFIDGNAKNCRLDNLYISYKTNPVDAPLRIIKYDLNKWTYELKGNEIILKEK